MTELLHLLQNALRWLGEVLLDGLLADFFNWLADWLLT